MTDTGGVAFEKWWPLASASVDRLLRAHHVSSADREDVIQEVAARAFIRQEQFTSLNHLTRWSCRVAANLRVDQIRRESRLSADAVPDTFEPVDTARLVEGRVALEAVVSAVSHLSRADRVALFGETAPTADRKEAVRLAVRRHRARARLAAMVDGMIAAFAVLYRAVLRRSETPGIREAVAIGSVAVAAAAVPVIGSLRSPPASTELHQPSAPASVVFQQAGATPVSPPRPMVLHASTDEAATRTAVPTTTETPTRRLVEVRPEGKAGVAVDETEPEDPKTLCVDNVIPGAETCVDRPGPPLPAPPLPE